jgi:hypothetical protein
LYAEFLISSQANLQEAEAALAAIEEEVNRVKNDLKKATKKVCRF